MKEIINPKEVIEKRIAETMGFPKYAKIVKELHNVNISEDRLWQKNFNAFYRVRRNKDWQKIYYGIFEREKNNKPSFENILKEIYNNTGNIEASFVSKMISTIDESLPIWDQYVLSNLGLKLVGKTKEEKLENAICVYNKIKAWYDEFVSSEQGKSCIEEFDKVMPKYAWFSPIKKIDFFLWSMR